jgi:poly-gamma-glutamate capsule biosynthesis protein CapA/YwtB (metallophosphatase superfamily)
MVDDMADEPMTLFLCGDVMPGRGLDQVLPHPGDPQLRESYADDARIYVRLAERANGPIPQPASFSWPWGDALQVLEEVAPDVRLINLETSVTRSADFAPGKPVHYRMSPDNLPCVTVARPDACSLANNHVLDFGHTGLQDTLDALSSAGLTAVGVGRDTAGARRPQAVQVPDGGRAVLLSCGAASSGIPPGWAATSTRPGVNFLPNLSDGAADDIIAVVRAAKQRRDVVVVSIHWGSNWGYEVDRDQVRFAHRLIDGGADLIHGHSSHHPRPIEVYRGKLILYGCGDCIDDYEGISGHKKYRDDLRLLYFASVVPDTGKLAALQMVPMQARKMRLHRAGAVDSEWLATVLEQISRGFGSRIDRQPGGTLVLHPTAGGAPRSRCRPLRSVPAYARSVPQGKASTLLWSENQPVLQGFFTDRLVRQRRGQPPHDRRLPGHLPPAAGAHPGADRVGALPAGVGRRRRDPDRRLPGASVTFRRNRATTRNGRLAAIHRCSVIRTPRPRGRGRRPASARDSAMNSSNAPWTGPSPRGPRPAARGGPSEVENDSVKGHMTPRPTEIAVRYPALLN